MLLEAGEDDKDAEDSEDGKTDEAGKEDEKKTHDELDDKSAANSGTKTQGWYVEYRLKIPG